MTEDYYIPGIQTSLNSVQMVRNETVKQTEEEMRLINHFSLMKDDIDSIMGSVYAKQEKDNIRKYITSTYKMLLAEIKKEFIDKNFKLIDALYDSCGVALFINKKFPNVHYMNVKGITVVF
jgi:RPA family protein